MKPEELAQLMGQSSGDQTLAAFAELATNSWNMYASYVAKGFSKTQAFELVKQWQLIVFTAGMNNRPPS